MRVLLLLLRLYPSEFRVRFQSEMEQTFAAAAEEFSSGHKTNITFIVKEALGILLGCAYQWLSLGIEHSQRLMKDKLPWIIGISAATAINAFAYGTLVPIGPRASNSIGTSLFSLGSVWSLITAALVFAWLVTPRDRNTGKGL